MRRIFSLLVVGCCVASFLVYAEDGVGPKIPKNGLLASRRAHPGDLKRAKDLYKEGKRLFDEGKYEEAIEKFREALFEDPTNTTINYLLGRAAFELGNFEEATFAYERVLLLNPNYSLARLEKARSQLALGARQEAKAELKRVLESPDLPPNVRANVELLLAQISAKRKHEFSGLAQLSHVWDSNATLGTGPVALPFAPSLFSLPTKRSDRIASGVIVLNHQYPLAHDGWYWRNGFTGYVSDNDSVDANDLYLIAGRTGLQWIHKRHVVECEFNTTMIWLGQQLYQSNNSANVAYNYAFSARLNLRAGGSYTRRHHFQGIGPSISATFGLITTASAGGAFYLNANNHFFFTYDYRYDKTPRTGMAPLAYRRHEATARYTRILSRLWSCSVTGKIRHDRYTTNHPIFVTKRRDDLGLISSAGITYRATYWLLLDAAASYIDNDSNIPNNDYHAAQGTLSSTFVY